MQEMRAKVIRAIYVRDRDGDLAGWLARWHNKGYSMIDLGINERDKTDGLLGRAYEAMGTLRVSDQDA